MVSIKKYLFVWVVCILAVADMAAQGWLGKDLTNMGNINVKELSESQRQEVLSAAKQQGLNLSDLETMLKARGLVAPDVQKQEFTSSKKIEKLDSVPDQKVGENILQSPVAIFGQELFESPRTPLVNNSFVSPTKDYQLGIGDNITIRVYGLQEQTSSTVINREGLVFIPYGGKIKLAGLTIPEAENKVIKTLVNKGFNSLRTGQSGVNISLDNYHGIQVIVWGSKSPGAYTIPAMSTVFDVLYLAGGPAVNRTFRNVEVIRNKKTVARLDLYDFLTKGVSNHNAILKNGDIVFLPYYKKRIRLRGEVKTPAIFELTPNESLLDAVQYAGGYTEIAYKEVVNVMRYGKEEKEYYTLSPKEMDTFTIRGGEIIDIQSINNTDKYRVELVGAIKRPGYYAGNGTTQLRQLVLQAGGLKEAALESQVLIRRDLENGLFRYEKYPLDQVMKESLEVILRDGDVVYFSDSGDINFREKVQIVGEFQNPGSYKYGENLSLMDMLFIAGGFKYKATQTKVTLSRKLEDELSLATVEEIQVRPDYWNQKELEEIFIQPGDVVTSYTNPLKREQIYISIEGEVKQPGVYPIENRFENLWFALSKAGGLNSLGNLSDAILIRQSKKDIHSKILARSADVLTNEIYKNDTTVFLGKEEDLVEYDTIALFNPNKKLKMKKLMRSISIQEGDRFIIPTPKQSVEVSGAVLSPNKLFYSDQFNFRDYITMGGGLASNSDLSNAFVLYSNGTSKKVQRVFFFFKKYPKILPGSNIVIPKSKLNSNKEKTTLTERLAIYSIISTSVSSLALVLSQIL